MILGLVTERGQYADQLATGRIFGGGGGGGDNYSASLHVNVHDLARGVHLVQTAGNLCLLVSLRKGDRRGG